MRAIRAHMMSKGYIAAWADEKKTVDVIDIQGQRGFPSSIRTATAVSDVYKPEAVGHDLEAAYANIESRATPVIVKLRMGERSLTNAERDAMVTFLDMHLERGRYADRAEVRAGALIVKTSGDVEAVELRLGDAITLSRSRPEVLRLTMLGLDEWEWRVLQVEQELVTGDGAVLIWRPTSEAEICTVSFPLSPTRLLVIGQELPDGLPMNDFITRNSKRWIVGARGSLNFDWAKSTGA